MRMQISEAEREDLIDRRRIRDVGEKTTEKLSEKMEEKTERIHERR